MPKSGQFPLPFPERLLSFEDMVITDANRAAIAAVRRVERWPFHIFCLIGPPHCGLTTVANAWAHEQGGEARDGSALGAAKPDELERLASTAIAIDRIDLAEDQDNLLTLISSAERLGGRILLTARSGPATWSISSPDLASRLKAAPIADLGNLDEPLMRARLRQACKRHFMELPPAVEDFLVVRLGLSFDRIERTVGYLAGSIAGKSITVPLARDLLNDDTDDEVAGREQL